MLKEQKDYICRKCKRRIKNIKAHKQMHRVEVILGKTSKTAKVFSFIARNRGLVAYKIGFMDYPNFNEIKDTKVISNKIKTKWYKPVNEYLGILKKNNLIIEKEVKETDKKYKYKPKKIYPNFDVLLDYLNIKYDYFYEYDKFLLEDEYDYLKNLLEKHSDKLFPNSRNFLEYFVKIAFKLVEIKRGIWNVSSEQLDTFGHLVKDKNFKKNFYKELYEPKKHIFDLSVIGEPKQEKTSWMPKYDFHSNIKTMLKLLKKVDKAFEKKDYDTAHRIIRFILSEDQKSIEKYNSSFIHQLLMGYLYSKELKRLMSN